MLPSVIVDIWFLLGGFRHLTSSLNIFNEGRRFFVPFLSILLMVLLSVTEMGSLVGFRPCDIFESYVTLYSGKVFQLTSIARILNVESNCRFHNVI